MIWFNCTNPYATYPLTTAGNCFNTASTTGTGGNFPPYINVTSSAGVYVWPSWQNSTSASSSNGVILHTSQGIYYYPVWHDQITAPAILHNVSPPIDPEVVRQRRQEEQQRQQRLRTAQDRANELLLAHLTPEQRETVKRHGWFVVKGGKSKNRYRISTRGVAGNVELLTDADRAVFRYCCHLEHGFPSADHHLAQKLMLEHDENDFLRLANRSAA